MNVSSVLGLTASRISNFCKFACVAITSAAVVSGSLALPASAAAVDTSDWLEVECDPHVLWCKNPIGDYTFIELPLGYNEYNYNIYSSYALALTTGMPVYKDCTYQLEFTIYEISLTRHNTNFCIESDFPYDMSKVTECYNSDGVPYIDLVDIQVDYKSNLAYKYTFTWSTADGYLDNIPTGDVWVTLLQVMSPAYEDSYKFNIQEVSASCVFDPGADYYIELTKQRQNKLVDLTKQTVSKMREALSEAPVLDQMTGAVDYVSGAIGSAAALISPSSTYDLRGDISLYPAFAVFGSIYNNVFSGFPPVILALLATVPLLAFLAWLFQVLFKSIL